MHEPARALRGRCAPPGASRRRASHRFDCDRRWHGDC